MTSRPSRVAIGFATAIAWSPFRFSAVSITSIASNQWRPEQRSRQVMIICGRQHEKGVPGKVVAALMGHAKVDTTLNVYTQVLDHSLRGAAEKVGSELITIDHKSEGTRAVTDQNA
jgi:hypothetical protein